MVVLAVGAALHIARAEAVWDALQLISANGDLWNNLGITLWRVTVGFLVAALVGLPLGIVLGANRGAGEFFEPVIPVLNTVSSAIWAIFATRRPLSTLRWCVPEIVDPSRAQPISILNNFISGQPTCLVVAAVMTTILIIAPAIALRRRFC